MHENQRFVGIPFGGEPNNQNCRRGTPKRKKMHEYGYSVTIHRIVGAAALMVAVLPAYVVGSLAREIMYDISHGYGASLSGSVGVIIFNVVLFGGSAIGLGLLSSAALRSFRATPSTVLRPSLVLLFLGIGACLVAWFLSGVLFFVVSG